MNKLTMLMIVPVIVLALLFAGCETYEPPGEVVEEEENEEEVDENEEEEVVFEGTSIMYEAEGEEYGITGVSVVRDDELMDFDVTVENTGAENAALRVDLEEVEEGIRGSGRAGNVEPGEEATINAALTLTDAANILPPDYNVEISVTSEEPTETE